MIAFITDDSNKKAFGKSGRRLAGTASRSIFRHLKCSTKQKKSEKEAKAIDNSSYYLEFLSKISVYSVFTLHTAHFVRAHAAGILDGVVSRNKTHECLKRHL